VIGRGVAQRGNVQVVGKDTRAKYLT